MDFCCNFVDIFNKQGSIKKFINFHIQFDVWIIYGIKNIRKWIVILFVVFNIILWIIDFSY